VPRDLTIRRGVVIPAHELSWKFSRSSGPGGQSVNTTDSRAELSFDVARSPSLPERLRERALDRLTSQLTDGVLRVVAERERSQYLNRRAAEERLAELLRDATATPPRPRRPTKPTKASVERRLATKKRRSETKRGRRAEPDA
jgi:ribosome-associated protein